MKRETQIPTPPFKASKKTALLMHDLWYGRITPDEARERASEQGFAQESIDHIITESTAPPSYWSDKKRINSKDHL